MENRVPFTSRHHPLHVVFPFPHTMPASSPGQLAASSMQEVVPVAVNYHKCLLCCIRGEGGEIVTKRDSSSSIAQLPT